MFNYRKMTPTEHLLDLIRCHEAAYAELPTFDDLRQCSRMRPADLLLYLREMERCELISRPTAVRPVRYAAEPPRITEQV